jgi:hypothetical protein
VTKSFSPSGKLSEARWKLADAQTLLDGRVLVLGGAASAEVYELRTGNARPVLGSLDTTRFYPAAIELMDGSVRIFGGFDAAGASAAKTWTYRP